MRVRVNQSVNERITQIKIGTLIRLVSELNSLATHQVDTED